MLVKYGLINFHFVASKRAEPLLNKQALAHPTLSMTTKVNTFTILSMWC